MTKLILQITKIIIALVLVLFVSSCSNFMTNSINGDGNVVTETRNTPDFKGIKAQSGLTVVLEQGDSKIVEVEADENLHNHIFTEVENGILKIYSDVNIFKCDAKKVYVQAPSFSSIHASSGASVEGTSIISSPDLDIDSSSGSLIDLEIDTKNLNCESSSGSTITLKGNASNLSADSSSGSSINLNDLQANNVIAESSSGSSIHIMAKDKLEARASSGSSITCENTPKELQKEESSGGSVSIR